MDLITTHFNADFDGVASMIAAKKLYPDALLVLSGGGQEHVRRFLEVHDLGITRLKHLDLSAVSRLILVDTQDPDRLGPLKSLCQNPDILIHVYDHHPDNGKDLQSSFADRVATRVIEPVGASTTVLIEQLKKLDISLTPFEATVLAIGLYEETGFLVYPSTTPRDLDAAAHVLRAGADLNMVRDTLSHHLDPDQVALLHDLLESSETCYVEGNKVLLASSTYDRYRGDLAEAVHKLAELEGYDAVFAAICLEEKVEIIGRSRCASIHVGHIAEAFGGGGHASAASAVVKGKTLFEVKERLARLLVDGHVPLLARDVMTTPVKVITVEATVTETEGALTKYGVNVLPVVDVHNRYQGLVTREIIQKSLFHGLGAVILPALMHTDVYTATPKTPFHEIERHMLERNQRCVPVLEDFHPVGVITRTDLLRTLHQDIVRGVAGKRPGSALPALPSTRHLRSLLKEHLPDELMTLLEEVGLLAVCQNVSSFRSRWICQGSAFGTSHTRCRYRH